MSLMAELGQGPPPLVSNNDIKGPSSFSPALPMLGASQPMLGLPPPSVSSLFHLLLILMTHVPEIRAINRLHFPTPVSGTCVIHIWHRIRLVPDSGASVSFFPMFRYY